MGTPSGSHKLFELTKREEFSSHNCGGSSRSAFLLLAFIALAYPLRKSAGARSSVPDGDRTEGHAAACPYIQPLVFMPAGAAQAHRLLLRVSAYDARFERVGPFGGTVRSLLASCRDSRLIYLGTNDGQLFKSTDGGTSWRLLHPGLKRRQIVLDSIEEDPGNAGHLYVGGWDLRSDGGGLFESWDGGRSWSKVSLPEANVAVRAFAISKDHPRFMIAGTGAGVFVSSDGGKTWQQRGAQIKAFRQTESVAINPKDPSLLYVGTWHLGYRSKDFGET